MLSIKRALTVKNNQNDAKLTQDASFIENPVNEFIWLYDGAEALFFCIIAGYYQRRRNNLLMILLGLIIHKGGSP